MSKPTVEIKDITPQFAEEILKRHEADIESGKFVQRTMNMNTVDMYATDMRAGHWALNGHGLSFDEDGNLMDGQHRLAAVVRAGVTVKMLIMSGLPKKVNDRIKTMDTFDTGRKRNLSQQLKIDGFLYYSEIGTAARMLLILSCGGVTKRKFSPTQGIAVSSMMQGTLLKLIRILQQGNAPRSKWNGTVLAPIALVGAFKPDEAELFATEFNEMANLGKTSPVLQFDKFLQRPHMAKGGTDYQLYVIGGLACALRAYVEDRKLDMIRSSNQEHVEWMLRGGQKMIKAIREVAGIQTQNEEELRK